MYPRHRGILHGSDHNKPFLSHDSSTPFCHLMKYWLKTVSLLWTVNDINPQELRYIWPVSSAGGFFHASPVISDPKEPCIAMDPMDPMDRGHPYHRGPCRNSTSDLPHFLDALDQLKSLFIRFPPAQRKHRVLTWETWVLTNWMVHDYQFIYIYTR